MCYGLKRLWSWDAFVGNLANIRRMLFLSVGQERFGGTGYSLNAHHREPKFGDDGLLACRN